MYGRRLYDEYRIPIGLIATYWGGTCVEAWSSPDALNNCGLKEKKQHQKIIVKRNIQKIEFDGIVDDVISHPRNSLKT